MKITINTFGTRGDVQPYLALGQGLKQAGHTVGIVSHQIFEAMVQEQGLNFYPLDVDPRQIVASQAVVEVGSNLIRMNRWLERNLKLAMAEVFRATLAASHSADLILNSGLSYAGWHVAEKLNIPFILTYLWPVTPSRHLPPTLGKPLKKGVPCKGLLNYWSTKLSNQMFLGLLRASINQCRRDILALPPMSFPEYWVIDAPQSEVPFIYGYSPSVIPKPPDWSHHQRVGGYWFLDAGVEYQPDEALRSFLANGPPPVYVGFGSMVEHDREKVLQIVVGALREANQRGILLSGWSALGSTNLPASILVLETVPHDWLFPQMAAVVHHGGAGTTAAGLRAGVPSVIVPSYADQYFWAWRVQELGVGANAVPRNKLTVEKLASAIRQAVEDDTIRHRAAQIGRQIRAENGVASTVEMIEAFVRQGHL